MGHFVKIGSVICLLLLAACTSMPPGQVENVNWQQHVDRLSALASWQVTGKLGFRSPEEGGSASLNWIQTDRQYELLLSGPFGAGAAKIAGSPDWAVLTDGDQQYQDHPQLMALRLTGTPIPVNALAWWIRGIPDPDEPPVELFVPNAQGLAKAFTQSGWQLSFDRYSDTGSGPLPGKVTGVYGDYSFRLVVSEWVLPGEEAH